jgi:hypothetical protein
LIFLQTFNRLGKVEPATFALKGIVASETRENQVDGMEDREQEDRKNINGTEIWQWHSSCVLERDCRGGMFAVLIVLLFPGAFSVAFVGAGGFLFS